jgi:adenine phosphoribosyltransferase
MISQQIKAAVRDVSDFPKAGIIFKDITPILKDAELCDAIVNAFVAQITFPVDVIVGIESRGFLFGLLLANRLQIPFVPIRKKGKLPSATLSQSYALEYGHAEIEMHADALENGQRILLHDDLLATGGTIMAAADLVERTGAKLVGFSFVIALEFLGAKPLLQGKCNNIITLADY